MGGKKGERGEIGIGIGRHGVDRMIMMMAIEGGVYEIYLMQLKRVSCCVFPRGCET